MSNELNQKLLDTLSSGLRVKNVDGSAIGGGTGGAGDASAANQLLGNASLASLDTKTPALGQALSAASRPVVLPATQITSLTPPSNTGYALDSSLTTIDTDIKSNITLHAGTNLIGKVGIDQTTPGTTNAVQANAGTNLNTSALALDATLTGGTQKAITRGGAKGSTVAADITSNPVDANTQALHVDGSKVTQPVSLATNTPTLQASSAVIGHVIVDTAPSTAVTNTGTFAVQSTPVTQADTFMLGGVNVKEINGVTPLMGTGVMGTGSPRVTIASDNDPLTVRQATSTNLNARVDNAGTFAVQDSQVIVDNAGFTDGTSKLFMTGYIFDEVAGTALTENDAAAPRINANRAVVSTIEDGTTRGTRVTVKAASSQPATTDNALITNSIDTASGTVLASASRGVATVNTDITNLNGKGIRVWQDLTVLGASSVCTFTIQEKDPVSGKFITLLASAATGAGINATGTAKLTVYPGLTAAANSIANDVIPRDIRIVSTVATAASTFSIGYSIIP
jgi:hypothetical protein